MGKETAFLTVAVALVSGDLDWAMHVAVNKLEGLEALVNDDGNGSACILPALQASHTGSGSAFESSLRPVIRLMPAG
jgi:hypothetical protein